MQIIRLGLEKNFDINPLLKEQYNYDQLVVIEKAFDCNFNIVSYINNKLTVAQMEAILHCYRVGLKVRIEEIF